MIRRDLPEVLAIEAMAFEFPWSEWDFVCCLRQRNSIGMVVEWNDRVIGFMIYALEKNRIDLLNLAMAPDALREGVGSALLAKLKAKLSEKHRDRITCHVRERNAAAQVFFRENGFHLAEVVRKLYEDTEEDAYRMEFVLPSTLNLRPSTLDPNP